MKIMSIYQINQEKDENRLSFSSLKEVRRVTKSTKIDLSIYENVLDHEIECESLETLYELLNRSHPEGFSGHSLSVSDIVNTSEGYYYCDSFGWEAVEILQNSKRKSVSESIQQALKEGFSLTETGLGKYDDRESYWRSQNKIVVSWYVGEEDGQKKFELYTREKKSRGQKKIQTPDYETMTVKELREIAKTQQIKSFYKLNKESLIEELKKVS